MSFVLIVVDSVFLTNSQQDQVPFFCCTWVQQAWMQAIRRCAAVPAQALRKPALECIGNGAGEGKGGARGKKSNQEPKPSIRCASGRGNARYKPGPIDASLCILTESRMYRYHASKNPFPPFYHSNFWILGSPFVPTPREISQSARHQSRRSICYRGMCTRSSEIFLGFPWNFFFLGRR